MSKTEEKYFLNIAGEFAVCSELAKRNIQANLTFGNKKAVDNELPFYNEYMITSMT